MIKLSNFFIFFVVLILLLISNNYKNISTSLLSTLPDSQNKQLLQKVENSSTNKILLLAVKGFDDKTLETIKQLEKEMIALPNIEKYTQTENTKFKEHTKKYQFFLKSLDEEDIKPLDIKTKLTQLYQSLRTSFIPIAIDKNDPLNLFKEKQHHSVQLKNGHSILETMVI